MRIKKHYNKINGRAADYFKICDMCVLKTLGSDVQRIPEQVLQ